MANYLLDANISPLTAVYLRQFGISVKHLSEITTASLSDREVVKLVKQKKSIVITFDNDFAETWYFQEWGKFGIIYLRLKLQTVEHTKAILKNFLASEVIEKEHLQYSLIVLDESNYRVVRPFDQKG